MVFPKQKSANLKIPLKLRLVKTTSKKYGYLCTMFYIKGSSYLKNCPINPFEKLEKQPR